MTSTEYFNKTENKYLKEILLGLTKKQVDKIDLIRLNIINSITIDHFSTQKQIFYKDVWGYEAEIVSSIEDKMKNISSLLKNDILESTKASLFKRNYASIGAMETIKLVGFSQGKKNPKNYPIEYKQLSDEHAKGRTNAYKKLVDVIKREEIDIYWKFGLYEYIKFLIRDCYVIYILSEEQSLLKGNGSWVQNYENSGIQLVKFDTVGLRPKKPINIVPITVREMKKENRDAYHFPYTLNNEELISGKETTKKSINKEFWIDSVKYIRSHIKHNS